MPDDSNPAIVHHGGHAFHEPAPERFKPFIAVHDPNNIPAYRVPEHFFLSGAIRRGFPPPSPLPTWAVKGDDDAARVGMDKGKRKRPDEARKN